MAPKFSRESAGRTLTSSWTLGLLAAIGSWNVGLLTPTPGLDPSWQAGLYMASHSGLHFGSQVVFTYGPLGFLGVPGLWFQDLAVLAFLYSGLLYVALCVSLVWALRRTLNGAASFVLTLLILSAALGVEVPVALTAVWCLAVLSPDPPPYARRLVVFGGAVLGATETLVLPRSGLVILAMCAITALTHPRRWRDLATFVGCSAVASAVLWFAAGQSIENLPDFLRNAAQLVTGYSEAMGTSSSSGLYLPATILVAVALVAGAAVSAAPGPRRTAAVAVVGIAGFALFKEAVVRQDTGHAQILFATAAPIGIAFAVSRRRLLTIAGVFGALIVALATPRSPYQSLDLNPLTHAREASDQVQTLISPGRTRFLAAVGLVLDYRLQPSTLSLLRGHTVHVDPWEASLVWAYQLNWDPLPVFQDYSAYTATLDRVNADALRSSSGPQRILRENTALVDPAYHTATIDDRYLAWDPPEKTLAMLCNYVPIQTTARWEVLAKVPNRCGTPRLILSLKLADGTTTRIPPAGAGGLLYAKISGVGVSGFERLRTLLYRARYRYVTVNAGPAYRLVPGTAGDGLLLDADSNVDYPAPFALSPAAHTIALAGLGGTAVMSVYRVSVRPPHH